MVPSSSRKKSESIVWNKVSGRTSNSDGGAPGSATEMKFDVDGVEAVESAVIDRKITTKLASTASAGGWETVNNALVARQPLSPARRPRKMSKPPRPGRTEA